MFKDKLKYFQFCNFSPKVLNKNGFVSASCDESLSIQLHANHVTFVRAETETEIN